VPRVPFVAWLTELLLPTRCCACGTPGSHFCADCRRSLPAVGPPWCARCGAPTAWPVERCHECSGRRLAFHSARAAVPYRGAARALVHAWKERGLRLIVPVAADLVIERVPLPAADAITSIPPDGDRSLRRGHQPARDLAAALGERWQLPVIEPLGRARAVERQRGLSRDERRANVRGAFLASGRVPGHLVLVDDVYTTGATVHAAASALRAAGARDVHVVTLARAVR
jgi:ComF family protein